jgi:hypothetical protein
MKNFKTLWDKHKVFILSLLAAVATALTPLTVQMDSEVTYKMIGFAAFQAGLGFIAQKWRGQGLTMFGIIGNTAGVISQALEYGEIRTPILALQVFIAIITAVSSDPKSRGYEKSDVITQAKIEGEMNIPAPLTSQRIKDEVKELKKEGVDSSNYSSTD